MKTKENHERTYYVEYSTFSPSSDIVFLLKRDIFENLDTDQLDCDYSYS